MLTARRKARRTVKESAKRKELRDRLMRDIDRLLSCYDDFRELPGVTAMAADDIAGYFLRHHDVRYGFRFAKKRTVKTKKRRPTTAERAAKVTERAIDSVCDNVLAGKPRAGAEEVKNLSDIVARMAVRNLRRHFLLLPRKIKIGSAK
jgi:hypothetical protein